MNKSYQFKPAGALLVLGLLLQLCTNAQQEMGNSMSQYFNNRMLWNAGFTGADGNKIYALQNRSWVGFDGAPVFTNVSAEFLFGANSAAGLQVMADKAGILTRTMGLANYAYRIKLNKSDQLRIGFSLAFMKDRLNNSYIDEGGAIDPMIVNNLNQNMQFDGNIGAVYMKKNFTAGITFQRLKENFSAKNEGNANLTVAQMGLSGIIDINNDEQLLLKPLMMFRVYKTTAPILDLGMQFQYNKLINAMLLYQTSGNIRGGAGIRIDNLVEANFFYNTNIRTANTSSQQYEVGIGINLKGKKQE